MHNLTQLAFIQVVSIMELNVKSLLQRGEKLEELDDRAGETTLHKRSAPPPHHTEKCLLHDC